MFILKRFTKSKISLKSISFFLIFSLIFNQNFIVIESFENLFIFLSNQLSDFSLQKLLIILDYDNLNLVVRILYN